MSKHQLDQRSVFSEIMEGIGAMKKHRQGKVTLRTHKFPAAKVEESPGAEFFVAVREKFNVSRSVWANMLRVSPRTVEKWEQGGQASPLAATFVELVSQYPDTIDRLHALPKRVSCFSSEVNAPSSIDQLRAHFRPKRGRVLFVGEAPPSNGTFFYAGNSQLYRYLKEALQSHLGNPNDFLESFKERGYFLDDLVLEPIKHIPRTAIYRQNIPLLVKRITQYEPEVVITLLKRISRHVEEAVRLSGLKVRYERVPFPGNGQQANFRRQMAEIIRQGILNVRHTDG